jgi:hypothetical protein
MYIIPTTIEETLEEFPQVENWLDFMKTFLKKEIDNSRLEVFYSYGYFVPKSKDREKSQREAFEFQSTLQFEERFNFEMSKVKVNLTIKLGNFVLSNRLENGFIPVVITKIVKEVTKVKMIVEGEYHKNQSVIDSIPPIDKSIISYKVVRDSLSSQFGDEEMEFDIDQILDKISDSGIQSLSPEEKEFLDKKSKGI